MRSLQDGNLEHSELWEQFSAHLTEYVCLELSGHDAEFYYPDIAFYIEQSQECADAYYQEFFRQGMQKPLDELRRLGNRGQVDGVMQQILSTANNPEIQNQDWYEVTFEQGRAWVDRQTERWRQIRLTLGEFISGEQHVPAFSGFLSAATSTFNAPQPEVYITLEGADFQLHLRKLLKPDIHATHCQLQVGIEWHDGFGDYSGAEVTLRREEMIGIQITDALGKVQFDEIPLDLSGIEVQITRPQ